MASIALERKNNAQSERFFFFKSFRLIEPARNPLINAFDPLLLFLKNLNKHITAHYTKLKTQGKSAY